MGRKYIQQGGEVYQILDSLHGMFEDMINKPVLNQAARLDSDAFEEFDLEVANELLRTLEKLYGLRMGRPGSSSQTCGFSTPEMLERYVQMKHWQKMLNMVYGPQAEDPKVAPENPFDREML